MKKWYFVFGILFLILLVFIGVYRIKNNYDNMPYKYPDGKLEYDFSRQSQPRASKILYEYISEDLKKYSTEAKKSANIKLKDIVAFEVDLNDDGVNEIVGYDNSSFYCGTLKKTIFILKIENAKYKNIIKYDKCFTPSKIYIETNKTNEYKNILLPDNDDFKYKQYYNGYYYSTSDYDFLKEYIDNGYDKKMPDGTIKYDFITQTQPRASKILYEYILNDLKMLPNEAQKFANINLENTNAIEIDLNDDGIKEVIGNCNSSYFTNRTGTQIFILEKKNKKYYSIQEDFNYIGNSEIYILPSKTNNYKDIIVSKPIDFEYKPLFLRFYNKKNYSEK